MKIIVSGATGLIGRHLLPALRAHGATLAVLTRDTTRAHQQLGLGGHPWDPLAEPAPRSALDGADVVIHLAGEPVAGGRWNEGRKRLIRDSRVLGTRHLVEGIAAADPRPRVLLSASAVGYYGDREEILDESAAPGEDFLAGVVKAWEDEAAKAEALGLRVVLLRIGVVLARDGGALAKMLPAFRMGVAGRLGHGRQGMPWVHVDDVVGLILHALDHPEIRGPVNAVAPEIVDNAGFTRALGKALHRPTVLPAPGFMLRLALGEMAGVLLGGQRLVPRVAERTGYQFRHPELTEALGSLLANPTGPDPATERASS
jgi:uncharacterized protein (TIGR01777 family)